MNKDTYYLLNGMFFENISGIERFRTRSNYQMQTGNCVIRAILFSSIFLLVLANKQASSEILRIYARDSTCSTPTEDSFHWNYPSNFRVMIFEIVVYKVLVLRLFQQAVSVSKIEREYCQLFPTIFNEVVERDNCFILNSLQTVAKFKHLFIPSLSVVVISDKWIRIWLSFILDQDFEQ